MNIKDKLSFSNVAGATALVIAVSGVGGAAYAAGVAKNSVGSPQIKNGQVKVKDLGANAVNSGKVKDGSLAPKDLTAGAQAAFTAGATAYFDDLNFHNLSSGDDDITIFETTVPDGFYLVSASGTIQNTGGDVNDFTCSLVQPVGNEFTRTIATSQVRVANGGGLGTIALDGVAIDSAGGGEITMTCEGEQAPYTAQLQDPRIVVVELGDAVEK
jgi:hypothetical protein